VSAAMMMSMYVFRQVL